MTSPTPRLEERAFATLYPDVDPSRPVPMDLGERIAISVASGVLAYGGAAGDLIVAGVGLGLVLFALVAASLKTRRRIRNEARDRFPHQGWAEDSIVRRLHPGLWLAVAWFGIAVICALALFFVPTAWTQTGAMACAIIAAAIIWFAPGINPRWAA